jgi:hypothetical protein
MTKRDVEHEEWLPLITVVEVVQYLNRLKESKSTGPDGIPNKLYKAVSLIIAPLLCNIINTCILERKTPNILKLADVAAIPKVTKPKITQIRGIALLSVPHQILESHVLKHQKTQLLAHIDTNQFAYRPGSSSTCALLKLQDNIINILENNYHAGCLVMAFDFSKAFDTVDHVILIRMLQQMNFSTGFIEWLCDYLCNRYQRVRYCGVTSDYIKCTSGVPQGSKLGPILFSLYTSQIVPALSKTDHEKFADDLNYLLPIFKSSLSQNLLLDITTELDNLSVSANELNLKLNNEKTKLLPIMKKGHSINTFIDIDNLPNNLVFSDHVTILGVTFSRDLSWNIHFEAKIKACNRKLFALRCLRNLLSAKELSTVYEGLVLASLEYANPLFLNMSASLQNELNVFNRRAKRILHGKTSYINFFPLEDRRMKQSMTLFQKALKSDHILHSIIGNQSKTGRIILPNSNTSKKVNAFACACAVIYNSSIVYR